MATPTKENIKQAFLVVAAVADLIKEVERIPSGHLWAMLMPKMSFDSYNSIIATLVRAEVIEVVNNEIIWIAKEKV